MKLSVTRTHTPGARLRALVVGLLVALAPGLASAQTVAATAGQADTPSKVMRVDLGGQAMGASQNLSIPRGKSAIVELPVDARDVLVSDPRVADAVLRSPRRIYIMGMAGGQTDAAFFDAQGRRILGLNIRVDLDYSAVSQTINRLIPGARVQVDGINNSLVLSGLVNSAPDAANAVQIAQQFTDKPTQIVNMIGIAGKEQVMLKVRIVEVQRSVIKQLGFNMSTVVGQLGSPQFIASNAATWGVNGALLGGLSGAGYALDTTSQPEATIAGASDTSLNGLPIVCHGGCTNGGDGTIATIKNTAGSTGLNKDSSTISAFEQVGLVRTLAEPNLTALSGESAKFLAGGEFPVPAGLSQNGQVTVEFKPYGVGLGFTPVVLSGGRISLKVSTEVSELTNQGSFNISTGAAAGSGAATVLTSPGLNVRRAETTIELPSGGAMMIAGLLKEETKQDIASLPGMTTLPVLGALFRSRDYLEGETELVVIVTPYIVKPVSPADLQTPADGLRIASDAETILLGQLNKAYKAPPAAVAGRSYQGPVGYVIE